MKAILFIGLIIISISSYSQEKLPGEMSVRQYLSLLQSQKVSPNAEKSKSLAIEALARSIKIYCHSKALTLSQCEASKMSHMIAYFEVKRTKQSTQKKSN